MRPAGRQCRQGSHGCRSAAGPTPLACASVCLRRRVERVNPSSLYPTAWTATFAGSNALSSTTLPCNNMIDSTTVASPRSAACRSLRLFNCLQHEHDTCVSCSIRRQARRCVASSPQVNGIIECVLKVPGVLQLVRPIVPCGFHVNICGRRPGEGGGGGGARVVQARKHAHCRLGVPPCTYW